MPDQEQSTPIFCTLFSCYPQLRATGQLNCSSRHRPLRHRTTTFRSFCGFRPTCTCRSGRHSISASAKRQIGSRFFSLKKKPREIPGQCLDCACLWHEHAADPEKAATKNGEQPSCCRLGNRHNLHPSKTCSPAFNGVQREGDAVRRKGA